MSFENLFDRPLNSWMAGGGQDGDVVLSSRIRLARNLAGIPFPNRADGAQLCDVENRLKETVQHLSSDENHEYMFIELEKISPLERQILVEKHIISPNHTKEPEHRALIVRDDVSVSIMVNEEDHLRLQCILPGLNLESAAQLADRIDDILEENNTFAFNEQMGYLTSCPTNIGTGLRASVMLHLPALTLTRQINRIVAAATQLGLAVRGLYGEGTEAVGNIFQISNQLTLGYTEPEIVANLSTVARQVVDQERAARSALLSESQEALADRVWRAYGVLRYARSISGQEALSMLSEVRLGIDLGLVDVAPAIVFNELLVMTRPNFLQKFAGQTELEAVECDRLRAQIIREKLKGGTHDVG